MSMGMRDKLDECSCDHHNFLKIFEGDRGMLREFEDLVLCARVNVPSLQHNGEEVRLRPKDCVIHGQKDYSPRVANQAKCNVNKHTCTQAHAGVPKCEECGNFKKLTFCDKLLSSTQYTEVKRFKMVTRENGFKAVEVIPERMQPKQIIELLKKEAPCWFSNQWEIAYFHHCQKKISHKMRPNDAIIFHDWAAITTIAKEVTATCSTYCTVHMESYIIKHSKREVCVPRHTKRGEGSVEEASKIVWRNECLFVWLPATGKKGNNWSNSNGALKHMIEYVLKDVLSIEREEDELLSDCTVYDMTDKAVTQYSNKEKMMKTAAFPFTHGAQVHHWTAPKHGFKGP
jgi:hypothetical protein